MMDAYCSRQGVGPNAVKFLFEGNIREWETKKLI